MPVLKLAIPPISVHTNDKQFILCMLPVITAEGYPGNGDDPHDPGGRTHAGIIQTEYDSYRVSVGKPKQDVYLASWAEVCNIYYENYWMPHCPTLWSGLNQMLFDQAVNEGPQQGVKNLQKALNAYHDPGIVSAMLRGLRLRTGTLTVDGDLGPATMGVLNGLKDRRDFLAAYFAWDMQFYRQLVNWVYYGPGWTNRANAIYKAAVALYNLSNPAISAR